MKVCGRLDKVWDSLDLHYRVNVIMDKYGDVRAALRCPNVVNGDE